MVGSVGPGIMPSSARGGRSRSSRTSHARTAKGAVTALSTKNKTGVNVHDRSPLRLRTLASRRIAGAGRAVDRPCQIQFRRRQQRSRPGSGRRPDRRRQCRAASARARRWRPTGWPAARRAIARCANSSPQSSSATPASTARADDILIVSGSLQALDLVNPTLLARGDTVLIEQETYQGALNRLTRLGVKAVGIPLDEDGMRMDALAAALADHKAAASRRNTSTPSRPCRTRPARSCRRRGARKC